MTENEKIFILQNEMLLSIDKYLSSKTREEILNKISEQKKILFGITSSEIRAQETAVSKPKPAIDDNYFDKKPLNINNI